MDLSASSSKSRSSCLFWHDLGCLGCDKTAPEVPASSRIRCLCIWPRESKESRLFSLQAEPNDGIVSSLLMALLSTVKQEEPNPAMVLLAVAAFEEVLLGTTFLARSLADTK